MKLIKAVIKPFKVEDVRLALEAVGVPSLTVGEALGMGRQKGHLEIHRGSEYLAGLLPKTIIDAVVPGERMEAVVGAVVAAAATGRIGDGKVFVLPVEQAWRIRTGASGPAAL